ncbi:MAG TPA: extracellular solute-binding protein [Trueperaceae bacterium]|nr:extracellular solute-binding protein [Trueperaceae bacterium]
MSPVRRFDPFGRSITRRSFLKYASATAAAAALGPQLVRAQGGTLRILQWSHFVPAYDTWFDQYARDWGAANGIDVVVDHINLADLTTAVAAEISAGAGHDLIEIVGAEAGQFEPSLISMNDLNQEAQSRFGEQLGVSQRYSYNPATENYYGFCVGWTIDPANYRRSLWDAAGMPDGPTTWEDLVTAGGQIRDEQGVQLGIGLAQEIDSNMAHRAIMSSFDAALQNEDGEVILDQGENFERVLESVQFMQRLYEAAMTPEVFAWNAASNNQALIAGRASYIMNSISAYRSSQEDVPDIAENVFFGPALQGPRGTAWANAHVIYNYIVPQHAQNPDAAQQFILDLAENYDQAMYHSKLYNSASFQDTPVAGNGDYPTVDGASTLRDLHDAWFTNDPFKLPNEADGKLLPLLNATEWTTNVGHPGVCSPAVAEVYNTFVVPNMFARAVRGDQTPEESIRTAAGEANAIFTAWRERGLV